MRKLPHWQPEEAAIFLTWRLHGSIVLLSPKVALAKITQSLKGSTARRANEILGRTGEAFWRRESYDHWVRNPVEFRKIVHYIEWNPAKAGLVNDPEEYPWSSARWRALGDPGMKEERFE